MRELLHLLQQVPVLRPAGLVLPGARTLPHGGQGLSMYTLDIIKHTASRHFSSKLQQVGTGWELAIRMGAGRQKQHTERQHNCEYQVMRNQHRYTMATQWLATTLGFRILGNL